MEAIVRAGSIVGVVLCLAVEAAGAASANAYTEMHAFQGVVEDQLSDTAKLKGSWKVQEGAARASAKYSASNTASVSASAHDRDTLAEVDLWGGDVLTIDVAGAGKKTITSLQFKVIAAGDSTYENAVSAMAYCFGAAGVPAQTCPALQSGPAQDALNLPDPKHVVQAAGYQTSGQSGSWNIDSLDEVQIQGPHAVVPMWYWLDANGGDSGELAIDANGALTSMDIILPGGVTCTSRSGLAFNGKCPKAAK